MAQSCPIEFGYNPPTGERNLEPIDPRSFTRDLQHVLDFASQHFSSLWVSDHLISSRRVGGQSVGNGFRLK